MSPLEFFEAARRAALQRAERSRVSEPDADREARRRIRQEREVRARMRDTHDVQAVAVRAPWASGGGSA